MLKIKDNVDLKELEKFGFDYDNKLGVYYYTYRGEYFTWGFRVYEDREIESIIYAHSPNNLVDDIIKLASFVFDLIQAGLIEKEVQDDR